MSMRISFPQMVSEGIITCKMAQASTRTNDSEPVSLFQIGIDHSLKWSTCLSHGRRQGGFPTEEATHLVRSDASTESRANDLGVDVLWQPRQVFGVQDAILLEASVFMVQVIRRIAAVLFSP